MQPFFEGLSLGLLLSILIGPVFFTLIKTSLENGATKGLSVAFGASASDMFIMSGCFLSLINISLDQLSGKVIGLFSSLALLSTGVYMIFKPSNHPEGFSNSTASGGMIKNFTKGFLVNSLNPFVFIFWMGIAGIISTTYHEDNFAILFFASGLLISTLVTDMIKVFISGKISKVLKDSHIQFSSMVIGVIYILYAIQLLIRLLM
jgi:threonine/homoserine/homoserine lactone efflux protein